MREQAFSLSVILSDGLDHAILALEHLAPGAAPLEALANHLRGIDAIEHVVKVVGVAAHHRAGEGDDLLRDARQHRQAVALSGVAGQLMNLVGDGEVEPVQHVAAHEIHGRHALDRARSADQRGEYSFVPPLLSSTVSEYFRRSSKSSSVSTPLFAFATG